MGSSASKMLEAMDVLPVGYRFNPTDDELLEHYLLSKNTGDGEEEDICIIPELDIYQCEPEELPAVFSELSIIRPDQEWWFFYEQDISEIPRRSAKGGHWNETGETEDVKSRSSGEVIGSKRILTFLRGSSSTYITTDWVMHEYHLAINISDGLARDSMKNYVLCKIKCKSYHNAYLRLSRDFGEDHNNAHMVPKIMVVICFAVVIVAFMVKLVNHRQRCYTYIGFNEQIRYCW